MIWYKRISAMMGTQTVMVQKEQGNTEYYGNSDNARHIRHNENYPDCADYIAYYVVSSDKEKTSGGLAENTNQSQACYDKIYHTKHPA